MAQKSKSLVHELFWPKHPETGHIRFCRLCNEECPDPRQVAELQKKGTPVSSVFFGAVQNESSPSNMINHVRQASICQFGRRHWKPWSKQGTRFYPIHLSCEKHMDRVSNAKTCARKPSG